MKTLLLTWQTLNKYIFSLLLFFIFLNAAYVYKLSSFYDSILLFFSLLVVLLLVLLVNVITIWMFDNEINRFIIYTNFIMPLLTLFFYFKVYLVLLESYIDLMVFDCFGGVVLCLNF